MSIEQTVTRVREDGWAVVRGIIPGDDVTGVRESVLATTQEAELAPPEWKRRVEGSFFTVNQSLAPYVSDRRIVGVAEALWGRHVKITVSTPVVRHPGSNPQGWHSDWPFNQKHAAIVEAPYPDTPMLRRSMRRFTRLTNAFSKKLENHVHALALYFVWYNFCPVRMSLKKTPAMAAGLAEYPHDLRWIGKLIDRRGNG